MSYTSCFYERRPVSDAMIAWLNVEATDAKGKVYHLDVDKKGFEGEEYTIS